MDDSSTTVFVDYLPYQIHKIWIFNLFSRFGKIKNIFVPVKRSKITGQSFAFVRFLRNEDAKAAITNINDSWYWNHKLVAKSPSFLKKEDGQNPRRNPTRNWMQNSQHNQVFPLIDKYGHGKQNPQFQSFKERDMHVKKRPQNQQRYTKEKRGKEIWRRKGLVESSKQGEQRSEPPAKVHMGSIKVQSVGNGWLFMSAVAKMSKLISTKDLEYVFKKGDLEVQIKGIGGRFIIITFSDMASRDSSVKDKWLLKWLEEIKPWKGEQGSEERFIWLSCYGMPLNAWSYPVFKEIGDKWGQFLQVDEATSKEYSYVKAKILIATNQFHNIEGCVDLVINEINYSVKVIEEESFRSVDQSLVDKSSVLAMVEDDDKAVNKDEVEKTADVESKQGSQQDDSSSEDVGNSKVEVSMPHAINVTAMVMDSINSPLEIGNSAMGSEIVVDSLEGLSIEKQPPNNVPNCLTNQRNELMVVGRSNPEEVKETEQFKEDNACNNANVSNNEEYPDHFDANQAPIQAAIKGRKGKNKRKTIDEILGYAKVNARNTNGKRNNKKCVVLRSAIASAALSASISSGGIYNRNKILLDEAQAIWELDKMFGISYNGEEDEVVSKIAEMTALNKERAEDQL